MVSVLLPPCSSQSECSLLLDEVFGLVRASPLTFTSQLRLNKLLMSYFQDDTAGASFRSMSCFGCNDALVSIESFNSFVVQPGSHFDIQLSPPASHVPIQFELVSVDTRRELHRNTLMHAYSCIEFLLQHVIKLHPDKTIILGFLPKTIPIIWKNSLIGKLDKSQINIIDVPSLNQLQQRICKSIDLALELKQSNPRAHFFSRDTGYAWHETVIDDSFDIDTVYLQACAAFPDHLRRLLQEKSSTLDKLAGVEPSGTYPDVEAIVRDGFSRASTSGIESHDMLLADGSTLGGTVFALHNECLSAEWLASYLVDTDNNFFMDDRRAKLQNDKDRLLRVYSNYHSFQQPTWLQFGENKNVYLYLSQRASAAEEGWLTIASYLIKLEIDFINSSLSKIPGSKQFRLDPNDHFLDTGVIGLGDPSQSSFAAHSDNRTGLTHPSVPGYSSFFLQVPTLAITNFESQSSHITWFLKDDKSEKPTAKISQDFVVLHAQLMAVQENFKHKVSCTLPKGEVDPKLLLNFKLNFGERLATSTSTPSTQVAVLQHPYCNVTALGNFTDAIPLYKQGAKRLTNSARKTRKLQQISLLEVSQKNSSMSKDGPLIFGTPQHYNRLCCWGSQNPVSHMRFGIIPVSSAAPSQIDGKTSTGSGDDPLLFSSVLQITEAASSQPPMPTIKFDFSKYVYQKRTVDKSLWPLPNTKSISSRKSLAEMMSCGQVTRLLAKKGIIPVVVSPNPHNKMNSIRASFGPLLDQHHQPVLPGACFKESYIYPLFRMKKAVDHHDVWLPNVWGANCVILRLAEKNGTPLGPGNIIDGLSPVGEVQRIISKDHNRRGFEFYGSGGNPVVTGLVLPNSNAKVAGDGATFESGQTILNNLNQTMELICERGTPIVVVLAGDVFPKQYHDSTLQKEMGPKESQAMYMGVYRVMRGAQEDPLSPEQILQRVERFKPYYPDLDETQMRFHLETTKKFILLPLDFYQDRPGGYHHLEVDTRDTRKPLCPVPLASSYKKVLALSNPYSENMLFKEWVSNNGHLELLASPFESGTITDDSSILHPLQSSTSEQLPSDRMALFTKRKQSFVEHWNILLNCSVAAFARQLLVNVDAESKIGPLIDRNPQVHTGQSELPQYLKFVTLGMSTTTPYLSFVGPEVQKSPTTHPIRTYDPKVMLLMLSNNGGSARNTRPGLTFIQNHIDRASDMFFQCFLVEIVKVQVLLEWSRLNRNTDGCVHQLPSLSEIPQFLEFIGCILQKSATYSMSAITHDQYELNPSFHDKGSFNQFFSHLGQSLQSWLVRLVCWRKTEMSPNADLFLEVNKRLVTFITSSNSGIENSGKQPFHCQHILMDFNELVDGFPFGVPKCPVVGFGGSFGAQLLQKETFSAGNPEMVERLMTDLLHQYSIQSDHSLTVLGLERSGIDSVKIGINSRELTTCESEHGCCMQYIVVERRAGCSKGLSNEPKVSFTYCHPIPQSNFPTMIAASSLLQFRHMVNEGSWVNPNGKKGKDGLDALDSDRGFDDDGETIGSVDSEMIPKQDAVGANCKKIPTTDIFMPPPSKRTRPDAAPQVTQSPDKRTRVAAKVTHSPPQQKELDVTNEQLISRNKENLLYRSSERRCDLMLGMVFGNLYGTVAEIGKMSNHTTQLRRDTARCVATEFCSNKDIYTLDNRPVEDYRKDRHIVQSMSKLKSEDRLMVKLIGKVSQICLDHFWFMDGYWVDKAINKGFMTNSLPILFKLLQSDGAIYFGLSIGIFTQVIMHEESVMRLFRISLVHSDDVCEIDLVKGSHEISDKQYQCANTFGRKDQKPETKFGFSEADIRQTAAGGVDVRHIIKRYRALVGDHPLSYRFIKLSKI